MIAMARAIARSGRAGDHGSKDEAEKVVVEIVGAADLEFASRYGVNYWALLTGVLNEYVASRDFRIRSWPRGPVQHALLCGHQVLRGLLQKGFNQGDPRVEPELLLEVEVLSVAKPQRYGVACGFHYLPSPEGDRRAGLCMASWRTAPRGLWPGRSPPTVSSTLVPLQRS